MLNRNLLGDWMPGGALAVMIVDDLGQASVDTQTAV